LKKIIISVIFLLVIIIVSYFLWWSLPPSINRHKEISLGNRVIKQIEAYRKLHGLPSDKDWSTLKKLGFEEHIDYLKPEYQKLDEENYELRFIGGFDPPYLLWNTKERKWKVGNPTFPAAWMDK
jgi:hypothetical protein